MKAKLSTILFLMCCLVATSSFAQNRWGIMGGGNVSFSSNGGSEFKPGFYVGGLYDIKLSKRWYVQPQLLFVNNGAKSSSLSEYNMYSLELPVMLSYRCTMSEKMGLRINAGLYAFGALFGTKEDMIDNIISVDPPIYGTPYKSKTSDYTISGSDRFGGGIKVGASLESKHFIYSIDGKFSLTKHNYFYSGHGYTASAGIGYKF